MAFLGHPNEGLNDKMIEDVWIDPERETVVYQFFVDEALRFREWIKNNYPSILEEYKKEVKKWKDL